MRHTVRSPLAVLRTGTADGTADGTGPAVLTDLITALPVNQQYTYVYSGVSQVPNQSGARPEGARTSDHDPQVIDIKP